MSSVLLRGNISLFYGIIKPLQINQTRNALTNHYINKKQRLIKYDRSPKNLEWAKYLIEYEKSEEAKETPEPHMIHLITLTKPLKGRPWWERDILRHFGFDSKHPKRNEQVLVKNTSTVNKLLQEVLHLVNIQPFKLPQNLPTNLSNTTHLVLRSNGEMVMGQVEVIDSSSQENEQSFRIESISAQGSNDQNRMTSNTINSDIDNPLQTKHQLSNNNTFNMDNGTLGKNIGTFKLFSEASKWELTKEVVQKELDRVVLLNQLNRDQFPTHYEYKHNQDGKMHRYTFNKEIAKKPDCANATKK